MVSRSSRPGGPPLIPYLDPDRSNDTEPSQETDPDMDLFFDSLVWEETEEEQPNR